MQLLRPIDAAEGQPRRAARIVGRHAAAAILVLQKGEVRGDLTREIVIPAAGCHDVEQLREEPPE